MSGTRTNDITREQMLRQVFANCADVQIEVHLFAEDDPSSMVMMIYGEGLCDSVQIGNTVLPELNAIYQENGFEYLQNGYVLGALPLISYNGEASEQEMTDAVFQGDLLLIFLASDAMYKLNICNRPQRSPEESSIEISIKGPKDGFVEDLTTNIALIRKRIRSNSLCCETFILGRRTRTKVGILYIQDLLAPDILAKIRTRLNKIDVDGIYSISQLEEAIADSKYALFPLNDTTGRPDYAVSSLLAGRFVLIVDGNPVILIAPATFSLILKSPEDIHFPFQYVAFARVIRFLSFWICVCLPGFWVSLTAFHQDQIPFRLMSTISLARIGLPFSAQMEMFTLLFLIEVFREAGVRMPSSIGQTLTVIGGLVIGDASIRAGLVSPSVVVVGAITAIMGATLVNQTLGTVVSIIRLIVFLISAVIGMYGLILCMILLGLHMSRLRSFGIPFLSPWSPLIFKDVFRSYLKYPWDKMKSRPQELHTLDSDHQGKDTE
ncbi:spore gernimation protein GerA [Paenibacillus pectinilyticus]|uniref:Spore gernimation protein GerA n=1 Tax=Paenibacillus pectinilyticus TaxID=512399 RepID=A0A1C1A1A7_9BACL|nr:spore germination protein [Paenibacillus pectinilyticus]OCT14311.1 spore gernimation protein GerA [Paenibacillus pectinilyticus]